MIYLLLINEVELIAFLQAAIKGGSTTFTKADVFVKPEVGTATFFSYMGPDGRMDDGYTEHSGCPVLEGEKWITTVWMRDGVRSNVSLLLYLYDNETYSI